MANYKRGKIYWYKFMWNGRLIRESTKQGNDKVARQMEAAHRTSLAKGEVGIREKKAVPTLADFCKNRLEPWAKNAFQETVRNNWLWFRDNIKVICNPANKLAGARLNEITNEKIAEFASLRLQKGYAVSTVNSTIRVIRRALHLAVEWRVIEAAPEIKRLPGERQREHVVTPEEETQYLVTAEENDPELGHAVICLADTGMRRMSFTGCAGSTLTGTLAAMERSLLLTARPRPQGACCT